jgi:hypothetical protein
VGGRLDLRPDVFYMLRERGMVLGDVEQALDDLADAGLVALEVSATGIRVAVVPAPPRSHQSG